MKVALAVNAALSVAAIVLSSYALLKPPPPVPEHLPSLLVDRLFVAGKLDAVEVETRRVVVTGPGGTASIVTQRKDSPAFGQMDADGKMLWYNPNLAPEQERGSMGWPKSK